MPAPRQSPVWRRRPLPPSPRPNPASLPRRCRDARRSGRRSSWSPDPRWRKPPRKAREVVVSGRAVCLNSGAPGPVEECSFGDEFGIESGDGTIHPLDPTDLRVEILTDERVNAHPLEVAMWQEDGLGKIIRLYTVQNGETIEPYYFCFTCNITSHLPGPCWCCQQEFEFKERPAQPSAD